MSEVPYSVLGNGRAKGTTSYITQSPSWTARNASFSSFQQRECADKTKRWGQVEEPGGKIVGVGVGMDAAHRE